MSRRATKAVTKHWQHRDELACTDFLTWYDDADRLRSSIAKLIGATAADIAFVGNAANALSMVIAGLALQPNDNIVTLEGEFPNYLYMPQHRGVSWERFFDAIDKNTRMIAISEVNYSTGFRPPLKELSKFAKDRNIILFVDGTQSLGALTVNLQDVNIDVYAAHGYKWLMSPPGAAFMAVSKDMRTHLKPMNIGWRSHNTWRDVDNLHQGIPELADTAEKYEGGGLPFELLYALEQAVEMILEIGPALIEQRVLHLAQEARNRLRELGANVPESGSQIVAAQFPGRDPSHLVRELKKSNVNVAARSGFLRVSPHFYNNEDDLEELSQAIRSILDADQK